MYDRELDESAHPGKNADNNSLATPDGGPLFDHDLEGVSGGVDEFAIPHPAVRIPTSNSTGMYTSSTIKIVANNWWMPGKSSNG